MNYSGFCIEYYPNGKVKWVKEFQEGQAIGVSIMFDEKGSFVKQINNNISKKKIKNESIICYEGLSYDLYPEELDSNYIFEFVEEEAQFNGNLNEFLVKNFDFSAIGCRELGINQKVYFKFVVEKDGSISNFGIVRGLPDCPECENEIKRVVSIMPKWKPAKNNGKTVRMWCQLPININFK